MTVPIELWAPHARDIALDTGDMRIAMTPAPGGWWRGATLPIGTDYAVSVDHGPPRPDPRSRWQPDGVHGRTRAIESAALSGALPTFSPAPLDRAVIYELHIGTFTREGTFAAAINRLDHLVALGVTHVELMPVAQFPGRNGWGYDGVDLFAAHAAYGGPPGLQALVHECHRKGLAVLIDVVHNHVGPDGNYLDEFGPYHSSNHETPWGPGINFDGEGSHEVRRFMIDSALSWLGDYGADGLRLDAVHAIRDTSECHFVAELCDEVAALERQIGRPLAVIAEYDDHDPWIVRDRTAAGAGLRAHWNDDFHHALHVMLTGERTGYYGDFAEPNALLDVLSRGYSLDGRFSGFRGGRHGKPFGDLPRDRLVAYTQSHDQIGNRSHGERLVHLVGSDRAKIAAAVLLTSPFVPMLFQGEEWAASTPFLYFCDLTNEGLRAAVRHGRIAEHGAADAADPTDPATRDRCVLDWNETGDGCHADMLDWYARLIAARRQFATLRDPTPAATRAERIGNLLRIERGALVLMVNLDDIAVRTNLGDIVLASKDLARHDELPPRSCALVTR